MFNDIDLMVNLSNLCFESYNKKTYDHAVRVLNYVKDNPFLIEYSSVLSYCVAMCHDLLEDTDVTKDDIKKITSASGMSYECQGMTIADCVECLTHNKKAESYIDYLKRIKNTHNPVVYFVKLADMKDHFMQKETLTDKLKEKYVNSIGYLL